MNTVPNTTDSERIPRRQAYARFLLFGDPSKLRITHEGELIVYLDTVQELHRFTAEFLPDATVRDIPLDAAPGTLWMYAEGSWRGWTLTFRLLYPDELRVELDADTRTQLEQIADVTPEISDRAADAIADLVVADATLRGYGDLA